MRHRVSLAGAAFFSLAVLAALIPAGAQAQVQIQIAPPVATAEIDGLLNRGKELEAQRRWADALLLYEEALRSHPGQQSLEQRAGLAKVHYDLARRYSDSSFLRSLVTLREPEALNLYSEVLLKINTHYVQNPDWKQLVNRGSMGLEIALGEKVFQQQHLPNVGQNRVDSFVRELRRALASRPIGDRQQARDTVAEVARLANHRLGLLPAVTILEYVCGATGALDEYSTYLTGDQLNDLYSQIEGNFVGLGIELKADAGALLIVNVITGSPAQRAGIKPGDRITAVGGRTTSDLSTDQAANLLQGQEGTVIELVAVTAGEPPRSLVVRREHVEVPSVDNVGIIDQAGGIGYLKLTCFQKTTSRDLDAALWKLHREGMKSLIMDLRGNPGGLLTSSVEIVDKFVEDGTIVSTRGRSTQEDFNYSAHRVGTWRVPLVVLIDGDSASASEIFAGAIRDHRRGTIVGTRSYGKGSVQGIFPLNTAGAGVRLTTAKFYSPNGQPYSKVGVQPDILVRQVAKPIDGPVAQSTGEGEDAILSAGLQAARRQVAQR